MVPTNSNYIVWIDTELSGLDIEKDTILETACVITNEDLKVISHKFHVVINQPDTVLNSMNDWCTKHHTESGLVQDSRNSNIGMTEAEQLLLQFLSKYIPKGTCPLAGNSIGMDRIFLYKFMPLVNNYLHYRIIDVSSIKELAKRWNSTIYKDAPKKTLGHRALDDIMESIAELQYYKDKLFICECI